MFPNLWSHGQNEPWKISGDLQKFYKILLGHQANIWVACYFTLLLLPSFFLMSVKFSVHFFFIMRSRNFICFFLKSIRLLVVPVFFKTSSLLTYSVHGIFSTSVASSLLHLKEIIRHSLPSGRTDIIQLFNTHLCFWWFFSVSIFRFWKASLAIPMCLRIAVLYFHLSVRIGYICVPFWFRHFQFLACILRFSSCLLTIGGLFVLATFF